MVLSLFGKKLYGLFLFFTTLYDNLKYDLFNKPIPFRIVISSNYFVSVFPCHLKGFKDNSFAPCALHYQSGIPTFVQVSNSFNPEGSRRKNLNTTRYILWANIKPKTHLI